MRRRARTDNNHADVVKALTDATIAVQSLAEVGNGCPDLLVAWRGFCMVLEVKDGDKCESKRELTQAQKRWHERWPGPLAVVTTPEDAVTAVIDAARKAGALR